MLLLLCRTKVINSKALKFCFAQNLLHLKCRYQLKQLIYPCASDVFVLMGRLIIAECPGACAFFCNGVHLLWIIIDTNGNDHQETNPVHK